MIIQVGVSGCKVNLWHSYLCWAFLIPCGRREFFSLPLLANLGLKQRFKWNLCVRCSLLIDCHIQGNEDYDFCSSPLLCSYHQAPKSSCKRDIGWHKVRHSPPGLMLQLLVPACFALLLRFYLVNCKISSYYNFLTISASRKENNIVSEIKRKCIRYSRANEC